MEEGLLGGGLPWVVQPPQDAGGRLPVPPHHHSATPGGGSWGCSRQRCPHAPWQGRGPSLPGAPRCCSPGRTPGARAAHPWAKPPLRTAPPDTTIIPSVGSEPGTQHRVENHLLADIFLSLSPLRAGGPPSPRLGSGRPPTDEFPKAQRLAGSREALPPAPGRFRRSVCFVFPLWVCSPSP